MNDLKEINIYGSGQRGSGLYILLNNNHIRVRHVIDTNAGKWNTPFYDTVISSPDMYSDCKRRRRNKCPDTA